MIQYQWILFDADDTLFHFDAFSGLQLLFSQFNVEFTARDYHEYQAKNKSLWVEYQNGTITSLQLQTQRFTAWAKKLECDAQHLNRAFLQAMAEICAPLDGAVSLLNSLKDRANLGIITNGFTELQWTRLERTGLQHHFEILVISEEVGLAKPHQGIFDHAFSLMGNPLREHVLMVGDTLASDILGGINAGIDTCWVNHARQELPEGINPKYQVHSLPELEALLK